MAENDKNNIFPISGLLLLLAALGFLQFSDMPFVGSRPDVSEVRDPTEKPKARLWQEPFRAVLNYQAKAGDNAANKASNVENSLPAQIRQRSGQGRVIILGVMVFGAPYAEETEDRLRRRYAVLTGLGQRDYVPDDPEHLDFMRTDDGSAEISMSNIMPFEWFSQTRDAPRGNSSRDSVLVLWINDDVFTGSPLAHLGRLTERLGLQEQGKLKDDIHLKIIGPAGSSRLQQMVAELETFDQRLAGLEIYSATATMDDYLLLATINGMKTGEESPAGSPEKQVISRFAAKKIGFTRTIASDRALAEKLLTELELRRVAARANDHIMLVAEWDTLYARSLLRIYEKVFKDRGIAGNRLIHFSYMRGIDGSLPGQKQEKKNDTSESGERDSTKVKHLERPIGESQYDYLRRLAAEAFAIEQQQLVPKGGSIRAIGVLGSDFYDKYLVLQALRQKFPDVLFFTTDLDARLLHPDNIKWTQNLVVASSFGLKWQDQGAAAQGKTGQPKTIPLSFRSNYQSSVLAATLQALNVKSPGQPADMQCFAKEPRIFEIGRNSAVELTSPTRSWTAVTDASESLRFGAKILAIALVIFLLLYFSSHTVKTAIKATIQGRMLLAFAIAAGLLAFNGWLFYLIHLPGEEPFSWNEGLSIWPTEILRFTAVYLALYFLLYSSAVLRKNRGKIAGDFDLAAADTATEEFFPGGDKACEKGFQNRVAAVVDRFCDIVNYNWDVGVEGTGASMADLWRAYLRRDSLRYRLIRLAPIIFFYVLLCFLIFWTFEKPVTPTRGPLSWWTDKIVLMLSVVSFIVLNFYVFDVTRSFRRFIVLAGKLPQWPQASVRRFCAREDIQENEALKEWMLIRLIAIRTDALGKLIFYPFIIWLFLFLARINYFDNWRLPVGLGIIITLGALYAWSSAFVLRRSAEQARATAIQRLTKQLAGTLADKAADQGLVRQIEFALGEVRSSRQGAFAPFSQHPVLQALLIPFGGVGGIYLFDFLAKLNI